MMGTGLGFGWFSIGLIFWLAFWAGVILLAIWLYKQFEKKEGAVYLLWGLILTITVGALFCLTMFWGGGMFGGFRGMMNWQSSNRTLSPNQTSMMKMMDMTDMTDMTDMIKMMNN